MKHSVINLEKSLFVEKSAIVQVKENLAIAHTRAHIVASKLKRAAPTRVKKVAGDFSKIGRFRYFMQSYSQSSQFFVGQRNSLNQRTSNRSIFSSTTRQRFQTSVTLYSTSGETFLPLTGYQTHCGIFLSEPENSPTRRDLSEDSPTPSIKYEIIFPAKFVEPPFSLSAKRWCLCERKWVSEILWRAIPLSFTLHPTNPHPHPQPRHTHTHKSMTPIESGSLRSFDMGKVFVKFEARAEL